MNATTLCTEMVEVFKTNVSDPDHAIRIRDRIHNTYAAYTAHFDLDDCDRILRVHTKTGVLDAASLIDLLNEAGCQAEILPD